MCSCKTSPTTTFHTCDMVLQVFIKCIAFWYCRRIWVRRVVKHFTLLRNNLGYLVGRLSSHPQPCGRFELSNLVFSHANHPTMTFTCPSGVTGSTLELEEDLHRRKHHISHSSHHSLSYYASLKVGLTLLPVICL